MKKIICLIIAIVSLFTVSCYAGTNLKDISKTKYEDAVNNLVTFGIIDGFSDNTFKPQNNVTRAQLSKMLVISMGMQDEVEAASKKYLDFSDVLSSHWGYGFIKLASDKKLVTGFEDGTFKPDGNVTYEQATTMIVRALGYKEEVEKSTLAWPNNYMTYAEEELKLFKSVTNFKGTDPATRGDIAILIWNALRTGVAEIVAENSNGLVYGPGTPMIEEYLGYMYINNAEVTDVEFDDDYKTAEVTFKEDGKKSKTFDFDAEDALEMFGKKVTLLYDLKKEKVLDIESTSDYKIINSEVSRISDTRIYIVSKSTGYKRPDDDNILLYGIDELEDAIEVILYLDDNTVEYCIAMGASDVSTGIVIDDYVKVDDDEYGIKVRKTNATKGGDSYLLADEAKWPSGDEVILYYINDDDYLLVLDSVNSGDAKKINTIEKDYIKLSNRNVYEFESEKDYTVINVNGSKLKEIELSDIDKNSDIACVVEYNMHMYIIVYEDAIYQALDDDLVEALEKLEDIIYEVEEYYDEADYTQESFAYLMDYVNDGKKIDHTNSINQINRATSRIETALEDLVEVSSRSELRIVEAKKELRELINDECLDIIQDEEDYTDDSYIDFEEAYDDAVKILSWTDATYDEVIDAYDDLIDAIDDLEER